MATHENMRREGGEGEQVPDQWLRCSVCLERFEEEANEEEKAHHAKMLNCAHCFCEGCLTKLSFRHGGRAVTCPQCRIETPLEGGGVGALRGDLVVENLLVLTSQGRGHGGGAGTSTGGGQGGENVMNCQGCDEGVNATCLCMDCLNELGTPGLHFATDAHPLTGP